jgi:hypothetical protein
MFFSHGRLIRGDYGVHTTVVCDKVTEGKVISFQSQEYHPPIYVGPSHALFPIGGDTSKVTKFIGSAVGGAREQYYDYEPVQDDPGKWVNNSNLHKKSMMQDPKLNAHIEKVLARQSPTDHVFISELVPGQTHYFIKHDGLVKEHKFMASHLEDAASHYAMITRLPFTFSAIFAGGIAYFLEVM